MLKTYNIKKNYYPLKIYNKTNILGAYPPSIVPEVDGCRLLSLQSVVLKKKIKQNLLIKNKITQENNKYHMYSHQTIITKYFCLEYKGK